MKARIRGGYKTTFYLPIQNNRVSVAGLIKSKYPAEKGNNLVLFQKNA